MIYKNDKISSSEAKNQLEREGREGIKRKAKQRMGDSMSRCKNRENQRAHRSSAPLAASNCVCVGAQRKQEKQRRREPKSAQFYFFLSIPYSVPTTTITSTSSVDEWAQFKFINLSVCSCCSQHCNT